jgi:16S rRNA A1518/A1519 N6-dimethyltransferase RsmA/KsgA/DIM1 with predicted DNA glycosylase/AP lyase activity
MRNALSGGLRIEKTEVEALLEKASLKPTVRAQELSLEQWFELYSTYKNT